MVVVPFETVTAEPSMLDPSRSCTCPLAPTDAVTLMVNLKPVGSLDANLPLFTVIFVAVATGPPPPPPPPYPPQPRVKLNTHTRPSPSAAR